MTPNSTKAASGSHAPAHTGNYLINIWPPGPRPVSEFMLTTTTDYDTGTTRHDFYGWDGSFLRSLNVAGEENGTSVDGAFVVNDTTGDLGTATGTHIRFMDIFGPGYSSPNARQAYSWAADGDYFCSIETVGTGFALIVEDVAGEVQQMPLNIPANDVSSLGLRSMAVTCALTANRAIVWNSDQVHRVTLYSLPDGKVLKDFQLGIGDVQGWSADLNWLLAYDSTASGPVTNVIDLTTGIIVSEVAGNFNRFTPDSHNLVGTDSHGNAAVLDWRMRTEVWTGPSYLGAVIAYSDPDTNEMLLWLTPANSLGGNPTTQPTYDYWIVSGKGSAFRFNPQGCPPIEASPKRICPVG